MSFTKIRKLNLLKVYLSKDRRQFRHIRWALRINLREQVRRVMVEHGQIDNLNLKINSRATTNCVNSGQFPQR